MLNEENYPMTYKQYEKRVIELFLEPYGDDVMDEMVRRVNDIISEEPNFIEGLYGQDCFTYDSPHIYGENCKKAFEDSFLRQTPVAQLRLIIG